MVSGDTLAPRASFNYGELHLDGYVQGSGSMSREALQAMSRGSLKRYLTYSSDDHDTRVLHVRELWFALLATLRDPSLIDGHMTAVCNAVCVFLQSASSSPIEPVRTFALSIEIWVAVFDALLAKFNTSKAKPIRQVLNTLIKILRNHADRAKAQLVQDGVLSRMASIVLLGKPVSQFKASMVIFEAFMRSDIPVSRVLFAIARSHGSNSDRWHYRLRRQRITPVQVRSALNSDIIDESISDFSFSIILAVADSSAQATAGTFFTSFMSILTSYGVFMDTLWVECVVLILNRYPQAIEAFKNYLLPSLLRLYPNQYLDLLNKMASDMVGPAMFENILTVLLLGCDAGLLPEEDTTSFLYKSLTKGQKPRFKQVRDNRVTIDGGIILLTHTSINVRIRTFEFLTCCTTPIRSSALRLLSKHFEFLYGDADPSNRGELSSITKVMIHRLRMGSAFLVRNIAKPDISNPQRSEYVDELKEHEDFLDCFLDFLERELGPNCSFPRHISALKALQMLAESGLDPFIPLTVVSRSPQDLPHWPIKKSLHSRSMKLALWPLMLNPFEEVRHTTALVLKLVISNAEPAVQPHEGASNNRELKLPADIASSGLTTINGQDQSPLCEELTKLVGQASKLAASTNRADHADGVGRSLALQYLFAQNRSAVVCALVESLEEALDTSRGHDSLLETDFSVHGYLLGLKYIIENSGFHRRSASDLMLKETDIALSRLLHLCRSIWHAVCTGLCVDSPETDTTGPLDGPKDFFSHSWRVLRDSNFLIQAILLHLGPQVDQTDADDGRLEQLRTIHALCSQQLTSLRHRGAFSTVAQTFALCCEQFGSVPGLRAEFNKWSQDAFQILEDQSSKLTRRSAGIPAIMACILLPSTLHEFSGVIETLASLARSKRSLPNSFTDEQQTRLPQVHALNCLREIFTNSRFREWTICWLVDVLDLAASSLNSDVWAIRNCGLMLFRACASRIGTTDDVGDVQFCGTASPSQSEAVLSIALKLLRSGRQTSIDSPELVFAGLDLMSRIIVSGNVGSQAREHILLQLGSPIWMVREHAARLYASQLPEKEALEAVTGFIHSMDMSDQNKCHGILLCSRELLRKHLTASLPFHETYYLALKQALEDHRSKLEQYAAPAVQSAFFDLVNDYISLRSRVASQLQTWPEYLNWTQQCQPYYQGKSQVVSGRPFESQLRSSSALNSCLMVFTEVKGRAQTLSQAFQEVAAYDPDAAAALLRAIKDQDISDRPSLQMLVDLYIAVVRGQWDEVITAAAMSGLSCCLESVHENKTLFIGKDDLERLFKCLVSLPLTGGRNLFNAKIRCLGNVLEYQSREMLSLWEQHAVAPLSLWTRMLSNAAKDYTEAATRLNAAKSLHSFRRCFLQDCDRTGARQKHALYSILYNFLIDDDEEIRDIAASTVSYILGSGVVDQLQLCPLAACHKFSSYIEEAFTGHTEVHIAALSRIMFPILMELDGLEDEFANLAFRYSVKHQLDLACHESHDLFEEERQNLYVDEIREIDLWYSALGKVSHTWLDDDVRLLVGDWALEGLRELTSALPSLRSGPLGVLSKLEFIILFWRVIRLAELSLQWDYNCSGSMQSPKESPYLMEMARLLSAAREYQVHPQAQKALEDSVRRGQIEPERF
ncbi:hypothetical protein GJ744_002268 [Endocarpon pusillum]|uniref:DUF2428 domain-containing protein n=1 Tax=Endocarpon pusillum TaxID=364733 RepID=A0A8H7E021_9EURO|nr:hypothetical protein GJ744_002268 [Endocarpon pusillum]